MIKYKLKFNITSLSFILIAGLFFSFIFFRPSWQIGGDGFGYYSYVRSFVFDRDFNLENEFYLFDQLYDHHTLTNWRTSNNNIANPYSIGPAILWAPFIFLAKLISSIWSFDNQYNIKGFNLPFQIAVGLATNFYFLLGVSLIFKALNKIVAKKFNFLAILTVVVSSMLPFYLIYEPSMAHALTVFSTALVFYLSIEIYKSPKLSAKIFFLLGLSLGLMFLVRWQDILFGIIPLGVILYKFCKEKKYELRYILILMFAFILSVLPQLFMWKNLFGSWVLAPQGSSFFDLKNPHFFEFLFSSYHGLFIIHPLLFFVIPGLFFAFKKEKFLTSLFIISLLLQIYINCALFDWFGGGSFGARRMSSSFFIFVFAWTFLWQHLKNKLAIIIVSLLVFTAFIFNGLLMMAYARGIIPLNQFTFYSQLYQAPIKVFLDL